MLDQREKRYKDASLLRILKSLSSIISASMTSEKNYRQTGRHTQMHTYTHAHIHTHTPFTYHILKYFLFIY